MLEARLKESEITKIYSDAARFYDVWANLSEAEARKIALEFAEIKDGVRILEVAVGTGLLFEKIAEKNRVGENFGIDLTLKMLEKAEKRLAKTGLTNYELKIGEASALEFADESFDILFNGYMLDLLSFTKIDAVLNEFRRVLKPHGKLVLINMTHGKWFGSRIYETLYRISPPLMGGCRGLQMSEKLAEKGFKIENKRYVEQMLFPSEIISARKF